MADHHHEPGRRDRIEKRGAKFVVLSKAGEVLGEHDTEADARKQLAAVEASKNDQADPVWRYDVAELRMDTHAIEAETGWMRVDAVIGRADVVLPYRNADGSVRHEFRSPEEVFDAASMASFDGIPLTNEHPPVHLDASNARQYAVGSVSSPRREGNLLVANILVTDATMVEDIIAGKRQLSPGYRVHADLTPGSFHGHRFDLSQRKIRGNHEAVLVAGRQGQEVALRMDSGDAVLATTEEGSVPIREDAFVKAVGSRFGVFQGNNGRQLSTWPTRAEAIEERDRLHRKNKPSSANRGASARSKIAEQENKDTMADADKTDTERADELKASLKSAIDELKAKGDELAKAETQRADIATKLKGTEAQLKELKAKVEALTAAPKPPDDPKPDTAARLDALEARHAQTLAETQTQHRADMAELEVRLEDVATAKSIVGDFSPTRTDKDGATVNKTRSEVRLDVIGEVLGADAKAKAAARGDDGYTARFYEQALEKAAESKDFGKRLMVVASGAAGEKRADEAGDAYTAHNERHGKVAEGV